jgi:hypothetical protein
MLLEIVTTNEVHFAIDSCQVVLMSLSDQDFTLTIRLHGGDIRFGRLQKFPTKGIHQAEWADCMEIYLQWRDWLRGQDGN